VGHSFFIERFSLTSCVPDATGDVTKNTVNERAAVKSLMMGLSMEGGLN
tara:strand:- start:422 stop:568 length:147 start_codon:yes stop_codon:yes gene_type:complete